MVRDTQPSRHSLLTCSHSNHGKYITTRRSKSNSKLVRVTKANPSSDDDTKQVSCLQNPIYEKYLIYAFVQNAGMVCSRLHPHDLNMQSLTSYNRTAVLFGLQSWLVE